MGDIKEVEEQLRWSRLVIDKFVQKHGWLSADELLALAESANIKYVPVPLDG